MSFEVNVDYSVPILFTHVDEFPIPQNSGVVDEDVQLSERRDGLVYQPLRSIPQRHVVAVGGCLPAHTPDFVYDPLCRSVVSTRSLTVAAKIVDYDSGSLFRKEQCMFATKAASSASNDGYAPLKTSHLKLLAPCSSTDRAERIVFSVNGFGCHHGMNLLGWAVGLAECAS
jgi:hypothetical protein